MGAAFDSEAEIKGEIKSQKNKRIHAPRVAILIDKWDGCYIPSYEVAKYNCKHVNRTKEKVFLIRAKKYITKYIVLKKEKYLIKFLN